MKRTIATIIAVFSAITMMAQTATEILDRSSSALSKAGGVNVSFTMNTDGSPVSGKLQLKGQKFVCDAAGRTSWFDGTTMWTYVHDNNEVNVTTPTADQVARMNPYAYLNIYKKGYTTSFGKNTSKCYEVKLAADGTKRTSFESVTILLDKKTYYPQSISFKSSKGSNTITVKSMKTGQSYGDATFKFDKSKHKGVEVVDLR